MGHSEQDVHVLACWRSELTLLGQRLRACADAADGNRYNNWIADWHNG